jgi:hypothetical protein
MTKIIFSCLLVFSFSAFAEGEAKVDARQDMQDQRIEKGIESGELTQGEQKRLEKQQGRIQRAEDRAMKDGQMSGKEARHINRMQNKASGAIHRARHNKRKGG